MIVNVGRPDLPAPFGDLRPRRRLRLAARGTNITADRPRTARVLQRFRVIIIPDGGPYDNVESNRRCITLLR